MHEQEIIVGWTHIIMLRSAKIWPSLDCRISINLYGSACYCYTTFVLIRTFVQTNLDSLLSLHCHLTQLSMMWKEAKKNYNIGNFSNSSSNYSNRCNYASPSSYSHDETIWKHKNAPCNAGLPSVLDTNM